MWVFMAKMQTVGPLEDTWVDLWLEDALSLPPLVSHKEARAGLAKGDNALRCPPFIITQAQRGPLPGVEMDRMPCLWPADCWGTFTLDVWWNGVAHVEPKNRVFELVLNALRSGGFRCPNGSEQKPWHYDNPRCCAQCSMDSIHGYARRTLCSMRPAYSMPCVLRCGKPCSEQCTGRLGCSLQSA